MSEPECPIVDILGRLIEAGHTFKPKDSVWLCRNRFGKVICIGSTFRDLCVNIVLAGVDA